MAARGSVAIDTVPLPDRAIQVTVPAKVAFDMGRMTKVTGIVLERLGCPACHSGFDIRFDIARRFQFDEQLNVRELASGGVVTEG